MTETIVHVVIPAAAARKAAAQGVKTEMHRFPIRLIRVLPPSGQSEFLVTSLLDATAFPAREFAALYHRR
ncbi:MAG TPA: hypothetical protein PLX20_15190 [Rhodocyclaceae bacterium]|nr:hypothetical protein [Rhodocyclaceae bacterium]HNB78549.1 hypothetical protein [Rhodocyclaceae bacterium]HNH14481.1 hypothetical protein [Rhodocyclaceae bacterium]